MNHVIQIAEIVKAIELNGHATIPVVSVLKQTENFLKLVSGTYYTYLPAHSINYVIARSAPNGMPHDSCTVGCLSDVNRVKWN